MKKQVSAPPPELIINVNNDKAKVAKSGLPAAPKLYDSVAGRLRKAPKLQTPNPEPEILCFEFMRRSSTATFAKSSISKALNPKP